MSMHTRKQNFIRPARLLSLCGILTLAALTENRHIDSLMTALLTAVSLLYAFMFVWRWQVW